MVDTYKDKLRKQREDRKANNNAWTKKYEKSKRGFLMRLYRNMKSRIEGVQKTKAHLYDGKSLLSKEEFYKWAINSSEFHRLFGEYEQSGYLRSLSPSADRVDSSRGYSTDNMEWVTMSVNSSRGAKSQWEKRNVT